MEPDLLFPFVDLHLWALLAIGQPIRNLLLLPGQLNTFAGIVPRYPAMANASFYSAWTSESSW